MGPKIYEFWKPLFYTIPNFDLAYLARVLRICFTWIIPEIDVDTEFYHKLNQILCDLHDINIGLAPVVGHCNTEYICGRLSRGNALWKEGEVLTRKNGH